MLLITSRVIFLIRGREHLENLYNEIHKQSFLIYLIPSLVFWWLAITFQNKYNSIAFFKFAIELSYDIRQWDFSCTCYLMEITLIDVNKNRTSSFFVDQAISFWTINPQRSTHVQTIFLPVNQLTKLQQISPRNGNLS